MFPELFTSLSPQPFCIGDRVVKNLPANAGDAKTWVRTLGQEDPL